MNGPLSPSGDVIVYAIDDSVEIVQDPSGGDVAVGSDDVLTQIVTGDQGPPGPRGNSVLYGYGAPSIYVGVNGDFYIDLNTALMYGPKAQGWPPGFSLIGPIGPQGIPGPPGPIGAPGNTIRNGSGPPAPALGAIGDFYIDTTNHIIYGPKNNSATPWSSSVSIIGPQGPVGPAGPTGPPTWLSPPVAWAANTAYQGGPPASLVTNAGASYAATVGHISGVDFNADLSAGLWALVASAGSPGQAIAQCYVGDTPPTGIQNNSLWWSSTDGCMYVYYFDGDSHQWVIAAPIPDVSSYLPLQGGTMTGALVLAADPTATNQAATKNYVDLHSGGIADAPSDSNTYGRLNAAWSQVLPITGGTLTGFLTLNADPTATNHAATKHYVDSHVMADAPNDGFFYGRSSLAWGRVVPLQGGTMTGLLILSADPANPLGAVTKQYADTKAPLLSPALSGSPTAPTQAVDANNTTLATTAYVTNQLSATGDGTPAMDGAAARGVSTHAARADHVHPTDTTRAPLASPNFTGAPTAPTPLTTDNSTAIATTAWVKGLSSGSTVYVSDTAPSSAPANSLWWESDTGVLYVLYNDGDSTQWVSVVSATDPSTYAVRYDAAQTLTATQQTTARSNEYAAPFDALAYSGLQINGNMDVSQPNLATAVSIASASSGYVLDEWAIGITGAAVVSAQQVTDAPPGYTNSLKVSVTTANAAPAAGDYVQIYQPIEGLRIARLAFGTASASPVAIGFWIKANRTGNYSGTLKNQAGTRSYPFAFTITTSGVWQFVTLTIPGDAAGAWVNTNACAMYLGVTLMCGTTYSGPAGAWAGINYIGVTGAINGVAATTDYVQITGVVMVPGLQLPSASRAPFIMRPYDQELVVCKRYFQRIGGDATNDFVIGGSAYAATTLVTPTFVYPVEMRAIPTGALAGASWQTSGNIQSATLYIGTRSLYYSLTTSTAGPSYYSTNVGSWYKLDARL